MAKEEEVQQANQPGEEPRVVRLEMKGSMSVSDYTLRTFVSPSLPELTKCGARRISGDFQESGFWLQNFVLETLLKCRVEEPLRATTLNYLRRIQMAFCDWDEGVSLLEEYLDGPKKNISLYFRALHRLETAVGMLCQGMERLRKLSGKDLYKKNDGTAWQRLFGFYNAGRHQLPTEGPTTWITNSGLSTSDSAVTFDEVCDLFREAGNLADRMSRPSQTLIEAEREREGQDPERGLSSP